MPGTAWMTSLAWFFPWMPPVLSILLLRDTSKSESRLKYSLHNSYGERTLAFRVQDIWLLSRQANAVLAHRRLPLTVISLLTWKSGFFPIYSCGFTSSCPVFEQLLFCRVGTYIYLYDSSSWGSVCGLILMWALWVMTWMSSYLPTPVDWWAQTGFVLLQPCTGLVKGGQGAE